MTDVPDRVDAEVNAGETCSMCGVSSRVDDGEAALTWSVSVEDGRLRSVCPACTRANIRSIEGKLAEDWW
jgi:hypothetical protein